MGRFLLLHNSPRVRRYFQALAAHVPEHEFVVRRVLARWGGPPPVATETDEIIEYGMRRKRARPHYGNVRLGFFRWLYSTAARLHYRHATGLMQEIRPDAVGVWGGNAVDVMAVVVAARRLGIPCIRFENGYLPNTTQMDLQGVNVASSVPRSAEFYRSYGGTMQQASADRIVPRAPHRSKSAAPPIVLPERYVFVPFQVRLDSQILLHSPWIQRMDELFGYVTQAAQALGQAAPDIVFKEHPSCPERYPDLHRRAAAQGRVHFANGNATGELIAKAAGVITINSTVGVESLLLGKPVLALGNAVFEVPGVTTSARSVGQITDWLRAVSGESPPPAPLREPFLRYLVQDYLLPDSHRKPGPAHFAAFGARLRQMMSGPGATSQR